MWWTTALYGGIGGAFTSLLTLAQNLTGSGALPPSIFSWILGVIIMFGLGALMASAARELVPLKAIAIGLGLPATINAYNQNVTVNALNLSRPALTSSTHAGAVFWISPAMAQTNGGRKLIVEAPTSLKSYEIWFYSDRGIGDRPVIGPKSATEQISIPEDALSVSIRGPNGWSLPVALPRSSLGGPLTLKIEERSNFTRSIKQAFGASSAPYEIEVHQ
jgi:hypothetical protein